MTTENYIIKQMERLLEFLKNEEGALWADAPSMRVEAAILDYAFELAKEYNVQVRLGHSYHIYIDGHYDGILPIRSDGKTWCVVAEKRE